MDQNIKIFIFEIEMVRFQESLKQHERWTLRSLIKWITISSFKYCNVKAKFAHFKMRLNVSSYTDANGWYEYTDYGNVPTKNHMNSGIFSPHFFNINPRNDEITKLANARVFYFRI
jgi:hypothetical protein